MASAEVSSTNVDETDSGETKELLTGGGIDFLDLPPEIRQEIYQCCMEIDQDNLNNDPTTLEIAWSEQRQQFAYELRMGSRLTTICSLRRACRTIYSESYAMYHANLFFDVTETHDRDPWYKASVANKNQFKFIRQLGLELDPLDRFGKAFIEIMDAFAWGESLDRLYLQIGDDNTEIPDRVLESELMQIGVKSEIKAMAACWTRIKVKSEVDFMGSVWSNSRLRSAEKKRQEKMKTADAKGDKD
ncbi:Hypothetical protein D9617_27g045360 [Elsinoe fawcettii]|nr:Hypothetical protein D9617_27g045360 [Elsinoe fawcettii]